MTQNEKRELLIKLAHELTPFNYVVQRNFESLPDSLLHEDLDILVDEKDRDELEEVIKPFREHISIDVRSETDYYFPTDITRMMLMGTKRHNGFKVPAPLSHFLGLYYHNYVHKFNNPYEKELKRVFFEAFEPVECTDKGVGFYGVD